jgi:hypothetical protein
VPCSIRCRPGTALGRHIALEHEFRARAFDCASPRRGDAQPWMLEPGSRSGVRRRRPESSAVRHRPGDSRPRLWFVIPDRRVRGIDLDYPLFARRGRGERRRALQPSRIGMPEPRAPRREGAKSFSRQDNSRTHNIRARQSLRHKSHTSGLDSVCLDFHATQAARHRFSADWISAVHLVDGCGISATGRGRTALARKLRLP